MIEPIRRHVTVGADQGRAFRLFTEQIGSWWPVDTFSIAIDREDDTKVESVVFEQRQGGRVYEVASDGTEATWATVVAWEPPRRVVLAWKPNLRDEPPTEVEITFTAEESGTRVDLEHRGWERLGERAIEASEGYASGWALVLGERYAAAADTTD
jgi:uncharacterized protein YndB with AHSA1/START domain